MPIGSFVNLDRTSADAYFKFNQMTPSANWVINHNLGKFPSVTVVDSAGMAHVGCVTYTDDNNLEIGFTFPFGGCAHLN